MPVLRLARLLAPVLALALAAPAAAQPSGDKSFSLGAGVIVSPRPYLDADAEITALPVLGLRYKAFYFEGIRTGFRGRPHPNLELDGFVQARFDGFEEGDSPALAGMADRDLSMDAGFGVAGKWDGAEVGLSVLADVLDESDGQEVELRLGFPFDAGNWRLTPSATVAWLSEDLVGHYFGVLPGEARPGRPAYAGDDTVSFEVGFRALRIFDSGWTLLLDVGAVAHGGEIRDSPIVDEELSVKARAALFYTWGR